MATIQVQQTDTAPDFGDATALVACSGRSLTGSLSTDSMRASLGGAAGSTPIFCGMGLSETNVVFSGCIIPWPAQYPGLAAGNITFPLRTSIGFTGTPSVSELHACRLNSSGTSIATCGSLTGQTTVLNDVNTDSWNIPVSKTLFNPGDFLYIAVVGTNASSMINAAGQFTPDQLITIPVLDPVGGAGALAVLDIIGTDVIG